MASQSATSFSSPSMAKIRSIIEAHTPDLKTYEEVYKHIHANPELSTQESSTAALVASKLREIDHSPYHIHESIGGHGLAAVMRNGSGRTVLLRADMDALPIEELSGVPYASQATQVDTRDRVRKPTMHACGHDMHVTTLLAVASVMASAKHAWAGTLVLVFQPAEERGIGASRMVEDGLYSRGLVPEPDIVLGQHVGAARAGTLGVRPGTIMSGAESLMVTFHGRGGHGSAPENCIDPVLMAAAAVVRLQSVVSRELKTGDETGVVTVGAIHAGSEENIIPDRAYIKLNMRSFEPNTLRKMYASVRRIIKAESDAGGAEKAPQFDTLSSFPVQINDPGATSVVSGVFTELFGDAFNPNEPRVTASEDFSRLATSIAKPCVFWFFGGTDPEQFDKAKRAGKLNELPINHSPFFAPAIQPTLQTAVKALSAAALAFLDLR